MSPLSPNTKLRIHRFADLFPPGLVSVNFVFGDRGQALVIVGKNKMCLRYSMYRTSPVLKTKTRQIGTNKNNRNTLGPYTQTLKVECVSMHVGMGGMPIDGGGVDEQGQSFTMCPICHQKRMCFSKRRKRCSRDVPRDVHPSRTESQET